METEQQSTPRPPDADGLAAFLQLQRGMLGWKQDILAALAGVSLSTVQRVERGDHVRNSSLEKLAVALGQPSDAFTRPRMLLSETEAMRAMVDSLKWMEGRTPVAVAPLRREAQLRALASTELAVLDFDLSGEAETDLIALREWLDLAGFLRAESKGTVIAVSREKIEVRKLYRDIFDHVAAMERRHRAVCLAGTYNAETNSRWLPTANIAVLAFRSKDRNPAAGKITQLWSAAAVDMRNALHTSDHGVGLE